MDLLIKLASFGTCLGKQHTAAASVVTPRHTRVMVREGRGVWHTLDVRKQLYSW